ncbi:MAG: hypothetical protein CEE40_04430 [Chloroflexi bacterium B3_Chlor]|nr:MAG: hypothetical protein CEE40_04430 [Chloroflexi bacterium B3_Chlor]
MEMAFCYGEEIVPRPGHIGESKAGRRAAENEVGGTKVEPQRLQDPFPKAPDLVGGHLDETKEKAH